MLPLTWVKYMSLSVKKLQLDSVEQFSFILVLDSKSKIVNEIVVELEDVSDGLIIDGITPETEDIAVELMFDHLKQQKQRLNEGDKTPSYLILENCGSIQSVEFWKLLSKILRNRQLLNDTIFFCGDHTTVPESILAEVDYCVMFKEDNNIKLKQLYKDFGRDVFKDYKTFTSVFEQITGKDNSSLIFDYTKPKLSMTTSVFWHS